MEAYHSIGCGCESGNINPGSKPVVANIVRETRKNQNFRTEFWTGYYLQMTLMCIPVCGEIGVEMHPDADQVIRVEEGQAFVRMGDCREHMDLQCRLCEGDVLFIPGGTWHNVMNDGKCPLKLSSLYAPPQHPRGTIHRTKADAVHKET